jgi:hypothetical protein
VSSVDDVTLAYGHDAETSLGDFLQRPVKINDFLWPVNDPLTPFKIKPWQLFLRNKRVVNRVNNYRSMSGSLHLRFVVNGNAFYYGRLMVSWIPLEYFAENNTSVDLMGASQRLHTIVDPNTCEPVDLTIPFFFPKAHLNLTGDDQSSVGSISVQALNTLRHANGSVDPVRVTIFAWMTDESLCCPTNQATAGLVPQAVIEKPGKVEKFATKSADMLGYMTAVPYIGKYAEAMSHVSMGAAKVAALFGWSKPPQSVKNPMVPRTTDELAT